jgi:hypothetical protein
MSRQNVPPHGINVAYAIGPSVNMTMNYSSVKSTLIIESNCEKNILNCKLISSGKNFQNSIFPPT